MLFGDRRNGLGSHERELNKIEVVGALLIVQLLSAFVDI